MSDAIVSGQKVTNFAPEMHGPRADVDFLESQIRQPLETHRSMAQTESMMHTRTFMSAIALSMLLVFSGCGGGSGMPPPSSGSAPGTGDSSPLPPDLVVRVPPPAVVPADLRVLAVQYSDDSEYRNAWGLAQIGAATGRFRTNSRRTTSMGLPGASICFRLDVNVQETTVEYPEDPGSWATGGIVEVFGKRLDDGA